MATDPNLTKAQKRDVARQEAARLKQEQARREKRNRLLTIGAIVVVLVLVVVAVLFINKQGQPKTLADVTTPSTMQSDGGIAFGKDGKAGTSTEGAPTVAVYYDYLCPYCGQFEKTNQSDLDTLRTEGKVTLVMHPINLLDGQSNGTHYSTRAANAFATVADQAPDKALAFSNALFANQPAEGTDGLSDDKIAEIARGVGVPDAVVSTFTEGRFNDYVQTARETSGVTGTPTIKLDGSVWDGNWTNAGELKAAVEAAASK